MLCKYEDRIDENEPTLREKIKRCLRHHYSDEEIFLELKPRTVHPARVAEIAADIRLEQLIEAEAC